MVKVVIDGVEYDIPENASIIDFIREKTYLPGFCYGSDMEPYGSCRLCIVSTSRGITTACTLKPSEGLRIETSTDEVIRMRKVALELMLSDHYGDCIAPCQEACPAHGDVQGYLALIALGKYKEAVKLMKEKYVLPAVLGRVCPAFCEEKCRRNFVEEPIAIRQLKRYAADYDLNNGPWMPEIPKASGKRVAIVGGGPAGLSCAFYLRIRGHSVTIFEAMPELGGMMRYGIPSYRLPRDILRKDISTIIDTGVEVRYGVALGRDIDLDTLRENFDAVFLAIGAWEGKKMGIPGEDLEGVFEGIEFLRKVNMGEKVDIGSRVIVVGGGNTAMDVARTCVRLGAKVYVTYRRSREEMPANPREVEEAIEEGVEFLFLTNPTRIIGKEKVEEIELIRMELGEPDASGRRRPVPIKGSEFRIKVDSVILAIGQVADENLLRKYGLSTKDGKLVVDKLTFQTNLPGVFAGGDLVLGPSTVIESIATGRKAAIAIDLYLRGKLESFLEFLKNPAKNISNADEEFRKLLFEFKPYNHWKSVTKEDYKDVEIRPRIKSILLEPHERVKSFEEVEKTISEEMVNEEVKRCMSCGCMEVFRCKLREYATVYSADQYTYTGEINKFKIDSSHDRIVLDNNKCVLCGLCVRFTHELAGEGIVDYLYRGFGTKISPPFGESMRDVRGVYVGELSDVCPVGAVYEKLPLAKPGPWKTRSVRTVCNYCSLGCGINIEIYEDMIIRVSSSRDSWNKYVCDYGRFERSWGRDLDYPVINGIAVSFDEAREFLENRRYAVILTPYLTNEEIDFFVKYCEKNDIKIGSTVNVPPSTATFEHLMSAKRVRVDVDINKYPLLKILLKDRIISEEKYDILVTEGYVDKNIPTLVLQRGVNAQTLSRLGILGIPEAEAYVIIGPLDNISIRGDYLQIPAGVWIEKEGHVTNSLGMTLKTNKVRDGKYNPTVLFLH